MCDIDLDLVPRETVYWDKPICPIHVRLSKPDLSRKARKPPAPQRGADVKGSVKRF